MFRNWFTDDNSGSIIRRTYIWNFAANVVYSVQSAVLLIVITRCGNLFEAGVFSIIYANTHMLSSIGNYNMRNFQVSDARNEYSFRNYWTSRLLSCGIMLAVGCVYGLLSYHDARTVAIVLFFVGYRITDGIEDVVHGLVQKEGRLDIASFAKTARIMIASLVFIGTYLFTRDLFTTTLLMFLASLAVLFYFTIPMKQRFAGLDFRLQMRNVGRLLWVCLPLCASALLQNYIVNSPKYAIDMVLSSDIQAIFNILFMPVFAINVLSMFIFNPVVADMGKWWIGGERAKLKRSIQLHTLVLIGITLLSAAASYLCGCELLGIVYGVDLRFYKMLLAELMLLGGITALATFFSVVVTIMRKQNRIIIAYAIAAVVSLIISRPMVQAHGLGGAAMLYGVLMLIVMLFLLACMVLGLRSKTATVE